MVRHNRQKSSGKFILFLVYVLLAVYLLNISLSFINMPRFFSSIDRWIFLLSGIFLALSAFRVLTYRRRH